MELVSNKGGTSMMIFSEAGRNVQKMSIVLMSTVLLAFAGATYSADSSSKSAKQTSTQRETKAEPSDWQKLMDDAKKEGIVSVYSAGWGPPPGRPLRKH